MQLVVGVWYRNDDGTFTGGGGGIVCSVERAETGDFGDPVHHFVSRLNRDGFVKVSDYDIYRSSQQKRFTAFDSDGYQRESHDDAEFCEVGRSMAVHYENHPLSGRKRIAGREIHVHQLQY